MPLACRREPEHPKGADPSEWRTIKLLKEGPGDLNTDFYLNELTELTTTNMGRHAYAHSPASRDK